MAGARRAIRPMGAVLDPCRVRIDRRRLEEASGRHTPPTRLAPVTGANGTTGRRRRAPETPAQHGGRAETDAAPRPTDGWWYRSTQSVHWAKLQVRLCSGECSAERVLSGESFRRFVAWVNKECQKRNIEESYPFEGWACCETMTNAYLCNKYARKGKIIKSFAKI